VFADTASANQNSLIGATGGATEQTTKLLAGQLGGQRLTLVQMMNISTQQLQQLNQITINTSYILSVDSRLREMQANGIKIKG
jgi:hypothetical protein